LTSDPLFSIGGNTPEPGLPRRTQLVSDANIEDPNGVAGVCFTSGSRPVSCTDLTSTLEFRVLSDGDAVGVAVEAYDLMMSINARFRGCSHDRA